MSNSYTGNPEIFDDYYEINRLIIIGNGFDLAHDLKTSFKDFIEDYFYEILKNIKDKFIHNDPLLSITSPVSFEHLNKGFLHFTPANAYLELLSLMDNPRVGIERESELLKNICKEIGAKKWVDIEVIFFKMLKDSSKNAEEIKRLNVEMNYLKNLLQKYLVKEYEKTQIKRISKIQSQFREKLKKKEAQPNTI